MTRTIKDATHVNLVLSRRSVGRQSLDSANLKQNKYKDHCRRWFDRDKETWSLTLADHQEETKLRRVEGSLRHGTLVGCQAKIHM